MSSSCVNNIVPLMWKVRGEWADWFQVPLGPLSTNWASFKWSLYHHSGPIYIQQDNWMSLVPGSRQWVHRGAANKAAIISTWTKSLRNDSNTSLKVCQRIKAILMAKTLRNIQVVTIGGRGVSVLLYVIDLWRCHRSREERLSAQKRSQILEVTTHF